MTKYKKPLLLLLCLCMLAVVMYVFAQADTMPALENTAELGRALGILSLVPPLFAVLLAFLSGDVILSLLAGVVTGAAMLTALSGEGILYGTFHRSVMSIVDTASDYENVRVLLLCVAVGGMEGVLHFSRGFEIASRVMSKRLRSPRKVNLVSQIFCSLFFFDDYANSLISGHVLTPVTDKVGVSREKLSYIVASTAAPLAGIAVISSWVAVEVSVIQEGLDAIGSGANAFQIFLGSIPYCFYCIFALAFVLLLTIMNREFGPMLEAERRARAGQPVKKGTQEKQECSEEMTGSQAENRSRRRMGLAFGSICVMVIFALVAFYITGRQEAIVQGLIPADAPFRFADLSTIIGCADTIQLIMEAALCAGIVSLVVGTMMHLFTLSDGILAWIDGASALFSTMIVLILAWSLAGTTNQLGTVYFVVDIISTGVPKFLVPTLIFVSCCVVSFAAGSYGCMFMIMPIAVPIVVAIGGMAENPAADPFMLSCVAAVLSGGIFGDHCSPMTDCTILAALGAGCETMDHVRTQMPYAMTVAITSVTFGTLLTGFGVSPIIGLGLGIVFLGLVIRILGKKP